jgi:hypothetical protein
MHRIMSYVHTPFYITIDLFILMLYVHTIVSFIFMQGIYCSNPILIIDMYLYDL